MTRALFDAYLRLEQLSNEVKARHKIKLGARIPRFDITQMAGYYRPLERLKNRKGQVVFYLNETRGIIESPDQRRADRYLMAKDSHNFSSIYLLSIETQDGKLIGYGNPHRGETFGRKKIANPFYECKDDGFIFIIEPDWSYIEVLIVPDGSNTILGDAKALADGVFDEALKKMRSTAKTFFQY